MGEANRVVAHYESIREEDRIAAGLGSLELVRTLEVLARHLPEPPASLVDVGGGTGVYAERLMHSGYRVHVVDLTPRHVEIAQALPNVTAELGDARTLALADDSFDAGLLLGPLYHLTDRDDRLQALREAARVVRRGGVVAAAAISRFASLFDGLARGFIFDPEFQRIVERDLHDGQHRNDQQRPHWFTTAYFHHPDELRLEIEAAQLELVDLVGVEGLAGWLPHLEAEWQTEAGRRAILGAATAVEQEPTLLGLSAHLLAIARVRA
jgi:SAM-dependent methyltransferase